MYFYEMDDKTTLTNDNPGNSGDNKSGTQTQSSGTNNNNNDQSNNNNNQKASNSDKAAKLTVYFKVCSQVLAAQMTIYQKIFNEYFKFCKWYIVAVGGPDYKPLTKNK